MGRGGFNRKSSYMKNLEGTHRADREGNPPKPEGGFPVEPPEYLPEHAKQFWSDNVHLLLRCRLLTSADVYSFKVFALIYNTVCLAEKSIDEEGIIIKSGRGDYVKNPAITILNQARQHYRQYAENFGLTPASRERLNVPDDIDEDDPMEEFFRRDKITELMEKRKRN